MIHLKETKLPLETNYGKRCMKALVEGASKVLANSNNEGLNNGVGLVLNCMDSSIKRLNLKSTLWLLKVRVECTKHIQRQGMHRKR